MSSPLNDHLPRIRGKTVYLLGAGFSVGTGAPLLSTFIPDGLCLLKDACAITRKEKRPIESFVQKLESTLQHYLAAAEFLPNRLVNLEDLFCLVDLRKQYDHTRKGISSPRTHETILKKFVVEVLKRAWIKHESAWETLKKEEGKRGTTVADDLMKSKAPPVVPQRSRFPFKQVSHTVHNTDQYYNACAYEAFLSQVLYDNELKSTRDEDNADFIVTLNYDLVIERKLAKISTAPIYYGDLGLTKKGAESGKRIDQLPKLIAHWPTSGARPLPLLKIHGSINWQIPVGRSDASAASSVGSFWHPISPSLEQDENIERIPIIPPTWRKTAASNTVFARLLGDALRHMKLAERIVIVGYSLPNTDTYFRYLLAEALGTSVLPSIELWDVVPVEEVKTRIRQALGDRIERVAYPKSKDQKGFLELVCSRSVPNPA